MTTVDVAVIGAGPAGLAAATLAAERGLSTSLFDEQDRHDATLLQPFRLSGGCYVPGALVWAATRGVDATWALELMLRSGDAGEGDVRQNLQVQARTVIVATGALERPMPIPGWTLPGVFTAGAAQQLQRTADVVPQGRTVLAGNGPLLWRVASQLLRAGVTLDALLDTTPRGRLGVALRRAPEFLLTPNFREGLALRRSVRRHVRVVEYVTALAIEGDRMAEAIRYAVDGVERRLAVDQVLLHQGLVPDLNLASAMGCSLRWNPTQACFAPVVDDWGGTELAGLFIAGDAAGVQGALAAESRGRLAALAAANALGRIDAVGRGSAAKPMRIALAKALRGRAFLDELHRPADAFRLPQGATFACRCEDVAASDLIAAARASCAGPNQMKALLRCGMGPCQGRLCGLTVTELIAREQARAPEEVGYFRQRFPVKPITLGEMATSVATSVAPSVPATNQAQQAVLHRSNFRSPPQV